VTKARLDQVQFTLQHITGTGLWNNKSWPCTVPVLLAVDVDLHHGRHGTTMHRQHRAIPLTCYVGRCCEHSNSEETMERWNALQSGRYAHCGAATTTKLTLSPTLGRQPRWKPNTSRL